MGWGRWASRGKRKSSESRADNRAITQSLFPCAVFVLIRECQVRARLNLVALLVTAFCSVTTLCSWKYKNDPPHRTWSYSQMYDEWAKYDKPGFRYRCTCIMMAWRTGVICVTLVLLGTLPAVIAAAIGKSEYEGVKKAMYNAEIGKGGWLWVGVSDSGLTAGWLG